MKQLSRTEAPNGEKRSEEGISINRETNGNYLALDMDIHTV